MLRGCSLSRIHALNVRPSHDHHPCSRTHAWLVHVPVYNLRSPCGCKHHLHRLMPSTFHKGWNDTGHKGGRICPCSGRSPRLCCILKNFDYCMLLIWDERPDKRAYNHAGIICVGYRTSDEHSSHLGTKKLLEWQTKTPCGLFIQACLHLDH